MSTIISQSISRFNPLSCALKSREKLTRDGSTRETYHIALDIDHKLLNLEAGDSIGILPQNHPERVDEILIILGKTGDEVIVDQRRNKNLQLREFLTSNANLSQATSHLLKLLTNHPLLEAPKAELNAFLKENEPADLLKAYPPTNASLDEICNSFAPLLPRFYSLASSPLLYPTEIHLTVTLSTYEHQGRLRYGIASYYLNHLVEKDVKSIEIFAQKPRNFTIPIDGNLPIIMIGPGTGIAPFRAFIQERVTRGDQGENWLFFGERNRQTDFYYEKELTNWQEQGLLKLSTAFSRDNASLRYVQDALYAEKAPLWKLIEKNALIYICGDAQKMAKDVQAMLVLIAQEEGKLSQTEAELLIKTLRREKRLCLDVY